MREKMEKLFGDIKVMNHIRQTNKKMSVLTAKLKKVDFMASDQSEKLMSALDKLREFQDLGYPARVRKHACAMLAEERDNIVWRIVAAIQR